MSLYPERPDIIASELWYYDDKNFRSSVTYVDMHGHSPEITNHLSTVSFKVISGVGAIAVEGMVAPVKAGQDVTIFPKHKYWYSGEMSLLIEHIPAVHPDFVTFGNEKLPADVRRSFKRLNRARKLENIVGSLLHDIDTAMPILWRSAQAAERERHLL